MKSCLTTVLRLNSWCGKSKTDQRTNALIFLISAPHSLLNFSIWVVGHFHSRYAAKCAWICPNIYMYQVFCSEKVAMIKCKPNYNDVFIFDKVERSNLKTAIACLSKCAKHACLNLTTCSHQGNDANLDC